MFVGDSKTQGAAASSFYNTYPGILGSSYENIGIQAGFGDKTQDVLNRIAEIILINPKQVVLSIGSNDQRAGVSQATFEANYASITSQLTSAGIEVIHLSPMYETALNLTAQYTYVSTNYSPFVDVFYVVQEAGNLSGDGIHPSEAGYKAIASRLNFTNLLKGTLPIMNT